jgi:hypothetical protein
MLKILSIGNYPPKLNNNASGQVHNSQSKLVIILQKDCLQANVALATQGSIGGNFFKNKFGGCKKENIQGV